MEEQIFAHMYACKAHTSGHVVCQSRPCGSGFTFGWATHAAQNSAHLH